MQRQTVYSGAFSASTWDWLIDRFHTLVVCSSCWLYTSFGVLSGSVSGDYSTRLTPGGSGGQRYRVQQGSVETVMQKQILDTQMGNKANSDLYSGDGCEETMSEVSQDHGCGHSMLISFSFMQVMRSLHGWLLQTAAAFNSVSGWCWSTLKKFYYSEYPPWSTLKILS